jgi:hypothetical protein
LVRRKEIAMVLAYTKWPTKTTWKAIVDPATATKVKDVDTGDTMTFALDDSDPEKIKIATFTCNHTGTPHNAFEWEGVYCEKVTDNEGKGKTKSNWVFTIVSSERVKNGKRINVLTWSVKPGNNPPSESQSTSPNEDDFGPAGGVCWTAEDG